MTTIFAINVQVVKTSIFCLYAINVIFTAAMSIAIPISMESSPEEIGIAYTARKEGKWEGNKIEDQEEEGSTSPCPKWTSNKC